MINNLMLTNNLLKTYFNNNAEYFFIPEFIELDGVSSIRFYGVDSNAFYGFNKLKVISFPSSIFFFKSRSISNLSNLEKIYIDCTRKLCCNYKFIDNCPNLKYIHIKNKKLTIKNNKYKIYNPNNVKI